MLTGFHPPPHLLLRLVLYQTFLLSNYIIWSVKLRQYRPISIIDELFLTPDLLDESCKIIILDLDVVLVSLDLLRNSVNISFLMSPKHSRAIL